MGIVSFFNGFTYQIFGTHKDSKSIEELKPGAFIRIRVMLEI